MCSILVNIYSLPNTFAEYFSIHSKRLLQCQIWMKHKLQALQGNTVSTIASACVGHKPSTCNLSNLVCLR